MGWIKDVRQELSELNQSEKSLRQFAVLMMVICIGILFYFYEDFSGFWQSFLAVLVLIFTVGLAAPPLVKPLHKVWMGLAFALGWLVSRVILTLIYFLVVTPIAFVARLSGKRFIDDGFRSEAPSYWKPRDDYKSNYEKMS